MKTVLIDGWALEYERKGNAAVVYAPFGFEINERRKSLVEDKLGVRVVFKNARPVDPRRPTAERFHHEGRTLVIQYTDDYKKQRARQIVDTYLATAGILPTYPNTAPITIVNDEHEWIMVGRQHDSPSTPPDRIKVTEGYTTQQRDDVEQTAHIFINGGHHTIGAIVHEIFHSLSARKLSSIWEGAGPNLEEAMTEYFTCLATGLFVRSDVTGGTIYARGLKILRDGIEAGVFSDGDMQAAYFAGDAEALRKIHEYFYALFNQ